MTLSGDPRTGARSIAMSLEMDCQPVDTGFRRRGVLILTTFALVWAMYGSTGVANAAAGRLLFWVVAALILLIASRAMRASWLPRSSWLRRPPRDWARRFTWIVVGEVAGIAAAVGTCLA